MEKHSPSYIETNHGSENRDGENYRYFSIKFVKEIEYADSSSSQEDLLDHECREKVRSDWSRKDGSDVKDQQSKKDEELEVKQLEAIPDTGVANLIEAWRQQTSHFQTMVEKNDELLEMNLHLMQEMSTIKTNNVHLQEELADVRQYVENMKRDLKQMVPNSTYLSKKYQNLAVLTSDHATCSTASTSSYETTSTTLPTTPWFTVKDPKDDDNLQTNSGTVCETPKTTASGTCTETDKDRSCTAISIQRTEKQNYLNSGSSDSILMRKFSNDQSSSRSAVVSSVNFDNVILNAHAKSNLPAGENTAVNGGQTTPNYSLTMNQLSNDHYNCTEDLTNAFWPIGNRDETPAAEIKDVLIRSSTSSKSSSLLQSSGSHDGGLSKRESWNQMKGNRSVTLIDNVSSTSMMENVPEERSLSGTIQNIAAASENAGSMSSSKEICVKDSIEEIGSLSKPEDKFPFHDVLISSDGAHQQSETHSGASGLPNERNDYVHKDLNFDEKSSFVSVKALIQKISSDINKEMVGSFAKAKAEENVIQHDSSIVETGLALPLLEKHFPMARCPNTMNLAPSCLPTVGPYVSVLPNNCQKSQTTSSELGIPNYSLQVLNTTASGKSKMPKTVPERHDVTEIPFRKPDASLRKMSLTPKAEKTEHLAHATCVQNTSSKNDNIVVENVGPMIVLTDCDKEQLTMISSNTSVAGKQQNMHSRETVPERHDIAEIPFRKPDTSLRKTSLTPKADKTEHLEHANCVQSTSSKNGNMVVENVGPMIVVRDCDKEQLTMISSNISVAGTQQNLHSRDKTASLTSQDDNLSYQKTADRDQNKETDNDKILIENVGPIITKPHPSAYTRAQVSKEESSSSILSSAAQKTLFISDILDEKSGLEELPEIMAVGAAQSPAAKEGKTEKEILNKTASTRKIDPTALKEQKPSFTLEDTALVPEYLCIFFEDAVYHPEADVKVPGTLRVTRDGYDGVIEFKCSDASLNFWQTLSDMQLLPTSSPYYTMWSTYQNIGPAQRTFRLSFQSIESASRLQSIVYWMLRHMKLDSQTFSGSQLSSSHREDPSTDHMDSIRIPLQRLSKAGVQPAGFMSTVPADSTNAKSSRFTSALGVSSQFSSLKCTSVETLGSVGKDVKHPTGFPFAEPDASDYQNSSLKDEIPVSSSHEKVPLRPSRSPTTAARPSVWNSDSSCGRMPSPPSCRFMFPCTVSILQEKVKEMCFKEKGGKSASGHDTRFSKKDSSQRQSAGVHAQDAYQTSSSGRLITARQGREANSSNLDIPQRDNKLDPRDAWKRLAKTCLSSGGGSRIADLSTQLLYASKIRNLQFATASRPATAPYQRTDTKPRFNGLPRTELSSQSLDTSDAKEKVAFSSPYICIFACHVRLVRLDPRGIRCDTKMLHPSVEFVEVQILDLNEPGMYKVVMLSGARVCASHFISKSMILQSLSKSSFSAQKSRSSNLRETQRDGSVQGSVTRGLNLNSTASQQQGELDVKDRYKSGSRFAAVVNALRPSANQVTPGGTELTLSSLGPGWIYTALDMSSKPLHMQCFVLVFPTQKLAIQFKAVFNRCRGEVQQASDRILVALSTFGKQKTQQNANWSCMHADAGAGAVELMTSSEILKDCQRGSVSCWRESDKSETTKRADSGAQQRCYCTRVASSWCLYGNNFCTRKPASVGTNSYNTAGVMASDKDCIADTRSEVMTSRRSVCHGIVLPASALISRSDPCCSWVEKARSQRTRCACWGRGCTEPVNPSFDAWRHSIGGAVGAEDVFSKESGLDIATYRRETWRKDAERCRDSSEHHVGSLWNCSCNCMNANDDEEATAFADLDNERSTQAFTTAVRVPPFTGDRAELHDTTRCSSYEENAHKIRRSTSAESTAAHAGTATRSELMELSQVERSRRDAGFQSRHLKEEEKGRQASCADVVWQSCAPIRAIQLCPETTVEADCLATSMAKEGRQKDGLLRHGTSTDAFISSGRLNTTARSDFDFLSPELQMDSRLWRSLGYLGEEGKDGVPVTSDLNLQGHVDSTADITEVFVEYTCSYCNDEDSLSIASDDDFLSLEDDDEENGADKKNAANDPDDPGEAGGNTLPNDSQPTSSHQSTFKGNIAVNLPAAVAVQTNTETLESRYGLVGDVSRGWQKEGRDEKPTLGDDEKIMEQPQDVPVAGRTLACRSTTCSQISLRSGPADEKRLARSPAVRHGGYPDFRHRQGPCPSTSPRTAMKRDEAGTQNGDGAGAQMQWTWPTGSEPHARRPLPRPDYRAAERLRRLAEREHQRAGSQGDSRDSRGRLGQHPSGSGNSRSTLASSRNPDSTSAEDEAVIVSRRDAYSKHAPRSGASESRRCWRDSPGRSTIRGGDASPPTASAVPEAGGWQAKRGAWPCTAHPGWTDLDGGGAGLSTSCYVRIVREGDSAARLIVTQLKDDIVLCNRVIDAGLIITQPAKKPPGKVVRLVMSAWHKGKRMKVALWLRFRSSKMADQFIVALKEAPRIS